MGAERLSVVVTRRLPQAVETRMSELFDVRLRDSDAPMSREEIGQAMREADVLVPTIADTVDAPLISQAGDKLKLIANYGAGIDHVDVATARQRGILVSNTPGVVTEDTADMAMALIIGVTRNIPRGAKVMAEGTWEGWAPTTFLGGRIAGRRLGILGMGRIGQAIARRCHYGFGMEVRYYNRSEKAVDFPARQVESLEALAGEVDFLVAAVPGGAETRNIIGAEVLAAMKPAAHLVNIARGDVVDQEALVEALKEQKIEAALLDVTDPEPLPEDHPLWDLDNAQVTMHLSGRAQTKMFQRSADRFIENLERWRTGEPVQPQLDLDLGY